MSIQYFAKDRTFYLSGGDVSYVMHVTPEGNLMHLYWGKRVTDGAIIPRISPGKFPPTSAAGTARRQWAR